MAQESRGRCTQAEEAVRARSPAAGASVAALGGLLLFVDAPVLGELDEILGRSSAHIIGSSTIGDTGGEFEGLGDLDLGVLDDFNLDDLDLFDSIDADFNTAFDQNSGDGGGDGDGGDGGGGGGGE